MNQAAQDRAAVAGAVASLLAVLTLSPLVADRSWVIVAVVAVISVMVAGIVGRQVLKFWPLVVVAQGAVLSVALTILFARDAAIAGVLPGPAAFERMGILFDAALAITREQRPPVESNQGMVFLLVASTGLVAIAVDLLAASVSQPALAGLPLLAVYCVPAALLPGGLPWYYFAAAAAGFLLLLSADAGERVRSWGRVLSAAVAGQRQRRSPDDGPGGLARGGRRVGAVTVIVAVLIPAMVPGLGDRLLSDSGDGPGEGDGSTIRTINPILQLRKDLISGDTTPLITYTTEVDDPEPLRIVTADVYDGKTWAPRRAAIPRDQRVDQGPLPEPPGLTDDVDQTLRETRIKIENLQQSYLPLPYPTREVSVKGRWLYDQTTLNVVGEGVNTKDLAYRAKHFDIRPTQDQLSAAGEPPAALSPFRQLPDDLPASIQRTAQDVAKQGTDYEQAARLQRWFRQSGNFQYSTNAPASEDGDGSSDAIADFLEAKKGYCVHFASAMAVMARTLGIPARVAVGFLRGEQNADGAWVITAKDAHAWPELYFQGVGWVRFEPTPRSGLASPPDWSIPSSGGLPEEAEPSVPAQQPSAAPSAENTAPATDDEQENATTEPTLIDRLGAVPWRAVGVVVLALLVAGAPLAATRIGRRRRWRRAVSGPARVEAAWDDLRERLSDLDVGWASSWTPRALQRRLITDLGLGGSEQAALMRLVADLEAARYAPPQDAPQRSREELLADVQLVVAAAEGQATGKVRLRARWLPSSGLRAIRDLARRADESAEAAGRRVSDLGAGLRESVGAGRDKTSK